MNDLQELFGALFSPDPPEKGESPDLSGLMQLAGSLFSAPPEEKEPNGGSLSRMKRKMEEMLFFWLNRRSQRRSYTWKQYRMLLKVFGLENPKIYVNIYG